MGRRTAENAIDWDLIQREYRLGQKTLRQMAAEFKVQPSAISRKAAKDGWIQDKAAEVKALSEAQLLAAAESNEKATKKATPDRIDIAAAAEVRTNAVLGHRVGLSRIRTVKDKLLAHVESIVDNLDDVGELIESMRSVDELGQDKMNDRMKRLMERSAVIDDLKKISEIDEKVRKGEREAFGIDVSSDSQAAKIDAILTKINAG